MDIDAAQQELIHQRAAMDLTPGERVRIFHHLLDAHDRDVDAGKSDAIEQVPNRINAMIGERHLDKPRRIYRQNRATTSLISVATGLWRSESQTLNT